MALGMIIPFFYTPVMLRMLGQAEYGLFSLSHSVVSYLALLSFGFGTTIVRYISKYRAEGDRESLEKVYGFFIVLYGVMAAIVLAVGAVIAQNTGAIFSQGLTEPEQVKMRSLVLIMTVSSALSFPISVFSSMVIAYERFVFRNLLNILSTTLVPIGNLVALWLGYQSVGMALAGLLISAVFLPWNIFYCRFKLRVRPRFARVPKALIGEMVRVSFYNFMGSLVDMLFWATDRVILGMLASSVAVAVYNIGATFNNMITGLSTTVSGVLAPKITGMVVKNAKKDELTELFVRVGRLQFLVIGLVVSGLTVFGHVFITMWAGPEYSEAYYIVLLTAIPLCIPLIQNTGVAILVAQNKQKFRSVVYLIIAVVNVVSTYLIVPYMGGVGAALCSCVSYLIGQGLVINLYYHKVTGIDIPLFWRTILKMAIVPAVMIALELVLFRFVTIENWAVFFAFVILHTLIYAFFMYRFVMNDYERDVVKKPLGKLMKKGKGQ
ncbi:MAG: oligosaccharide flippase family protein [Clostridia bacterium]|nr:oligosaccharide flippase family protein [Clostridia bacterium]